MCVLVTGGAGFIGSAVCRHLVSDHKFRVVNVDSLTYAANLHSLDPIATSPLYIFERADICDRRAIDAIFRRHQPTAVIHLAAESHVDRSITGAAAFIESNIVGTYHLLEAARDHYTRLPSNLQSGFRFVHVSTDEVYGSLGPVGRFQEETPYQPNSPYSASKAASDHLVRAYHHTYGLQVTTSNCSNNYGPFHFPEKLIPLMIVNLLHGRALPIYGDGRNVRDWLHVGDHCHGIDLILEKGSSGDVYNIGGGVESENLKLVETLCAVADEAFRTQPELCSRFPGCPAASGGRSSSLVQFVKDRPGHDRRYAIDCGKIERELGYRARVTLPSGLRATFDWYVQNEWWWRAVMDGSYQRWIELHYR